jgi:hypothetical protein
MIMRKMLFATSLAASWALPLSAHDTLPEGIWTNAEDVYFAEEEDRKKAEWTGIEVGANGRWRMIDAFAAPRSEWSGEAIPGLKRREGGGWQIGASELRKARRFFCWVSVRKYQPKEDGSEAWTFQRNLANFDQGGRIFIDGKSEAPDVTIRLRNVTWAKESRNKPALVLYMHKQDPVRAESYSWAAPHSTMIGINLRWVQASCSQSESAAESP